MRRKKIIFAGVFLFSIYTIFWFWYFEKPQNKNIAYLPKKFYAAFIKKASLVLGTQISEPSLPESYKITIDQRRQFFNLSCEFATAAGIVFHFTANPVFAVNNESTAEKTLINKVLISKNPNVGLRMGQNTADLESLYINLNQGFGGADYYGIHAPPFIDVFERYKLISKPIYINDLTISSLQKAIFNNHLIMAWIKIGYAKPIDDSLSYGKVKIVRGEHAIVINGYDKIGVIAMDPAIGQDRHIDYSTLLDASFPFPIPFLEVYKSQDNEVSDIIIGIDTPTEIDRSLPKIYVENGTKSTGVANQMRDILKDFGYNVTGIGNADNFDYQDISIQTKKDFGDYLYILKRDIKIASFAVASSSANLAEDVAYDIIVVVGK